MASSSIRHIGGKRFVLAERHNTKRSAKSHAKAIRKHGKHQARVIDNKVYIH
jgi:hypothetical protein